MLEKRVRETARKVLYLQKKTATTPEDFRTVAEYFSALESLSFDISLCADEAFVTPEEMSDEQNGIVEWNSLFLCQLKICIIFRKQWLYSEKRKHENGSFSQDTDRS